ncbi:MAG: alpha-1,2-fucosyltransferase [Chlorobiaceae bacterium]
MFQYALGRSLSIRNGADLLLDLSLYESEQSILEKRSYALQPFRLKGGDAHEGDIFHCNRNRTTGLSFLIFRLTGRVFSKETYVYIKEKSVGFDPLLLRARHQNICLDGYWQTERYFLDVADEIRGDYTLREECAVDGFPLANDIRNSKSVSLHIRRGDYVHNARTNNYHGLCPLEYYQKAVRLVEEKVVTPSFYVFSDDVAWAKEHLKINHPVTFVSDGKLKDYEELVLMSCCQHNIIANSSFSWWGAWLNKNPGKIVVAPKQWFANRQISSKDIIPDRWIMI